MVSPAQSSSSHVVRRPDRTQRGGLESSTRRGSRAIASDQRRTARVGLLPDRPRRRWRRPARGDLRCPSRRRPRGKSGGGATPRPGARPRRRRPPPQRPPARRRRVLPGPDPLSHGHRRPAGQRPQREGHADRRPPVVPARLDAARHHGDHRAAPGAAVAPATDHRLRRRVADRQRAPHLPIAQAMAVQSDRPANRSTRRVTPRTPPGSRLLDRRWSL